METKPQPLTPPVSTAGGDPSAIEPPAPPATTDKPRRVHRKKETQSAPAPQPQAPVKPTPDPKEVAALAASISMTVKLLAGLLVAARGDVYALKVVDPVTMEPPKRKANGEMPEGIHQADLVGQLWAIPLAPYLLSENMPWAAALVGTGAIFGPMVVADFSRPKDERKPKPKPTGPALVKDEVPQ